MNVLLTGSNGQLGNEIKRINTGLNLIIFETDIHNLDITDLKSVSEYIKDKEIDFIINSAAYTNVDGAEKEQKKAYDINRKGVLNIAKAAKKFNCKLIHISTDYVFDGHSKSDPYKETDKTNPQSVYGKSKLSGEFEALKNPDTLIIRTSWLYSSFGNNFVKTMLRLGKEKENLNVVFDQIGTPTYAKDLAQVIIKIAEQSIKNPETFISGIYHFSNEGVCSWYDFSVEIMKIAKLKCNVFPVESSGFHTVAQRPSYSVLNKNKIKQNFNISIPHWRDSLIKCLKELLAY